MTTPYKDPFAHLSFKQKFFLSLKIGGVVGIFIVGYVIMNGDAPKPSPDARPEPQTTTQTTNFIPGLTPPDVYLNFKQKSFDCGKIQVTMIDGVPNNSWTCTSETADHSYTVQVQGEGSVMNVKSVEATSLNFGERDTNAVAKSFLGYAASLTYQNATPEEARAWVENNVGKNTEKTFAGVKYELVSNARARILTISMPEPVATTSTVKQ